MTKNDIAKLQACNLEMLLQLKAIHKVAKDMCGLVFEEELSDDPLVSKLHKAFFDITYLAIPASIIEQVQAELIKDVADAEAKIGIFEDRKVKRSHGMNK